MKSDKPVTFGRIRKRDVSALCRFYNKLSHESIRTFRPLGTETTLDACRDIANDNSPDRNLKYDLLAWRDGKLIGWCFLWNLDSPEPMFGLAVADSLQGQGIGTALANRIMSFAAQRGIGRVILTVVKDNRRAQRIYKRLSFSACGEYVEQNDGLTYLRMAADLRPQNSPRNAARQPNGRPSPNG